MDNRNISSIKDYVVHNVRNFIEQKTDEHRKKELHKKGREHLKLFEDVNRRDGPGYDNSCHRKYFAHLRSKESSSIIKSYKKDLLYLALLGAIEEHTFIEYSHRNDTYYTAGEIFLISAHHPDGDDKSDYFQEDAPRGILWNLLTFMILRDGSDLVEKAKSSVHRFVEYKRFVEGDGITLYVPTTEVYLWKFIEEMGFKIWSGIPGDEKGITLSFHNFGDDPEP
jgi:hypothetical protein